MYKKFLQKLKPKPPKLEYIEVHLVDHCNLNCKGCTHYSNLVTESSGSFLDLEEFECDINEISKKVRLRKLRLMGGEPLLHPKIADFFYVARKVFPNTYISLVTNGILLNKMPDTFWKAVKENNLFIDISKYPPVSHKMGDIIDLIDENKCTLGNIRAIRGFFPLFELDGSLNGHKDCSNLNCKNLRHGKLYICPSVAYLDIFNKYFNLNLPEDGGVDIYKSSGKELIKLINSPIKLCKYCDGYKKKKLFPWEQSKCELSEWLMPDEE